MLTTWDKIESSSTSSLSSSRSSCVLTPGGLTDPAPASMTRRCEADRDSAHHISLRPASNNRGHNLNTVTWFPTLSYLAHHNQHDDPVWPLLPSRHLQHDGLPQPEEQAEAAGDRVRGKSASLNIIVHYLCTVICYCPHLSVFLSCAWIKLNILYSGESSFCLVCLQSF